ncbi:hypothetical protein [Rhizobium leguminosarum]|jgi:hypothetical protein|nr:hypothetical protein [Rhizobium leguminosarum]
MATTDWPKEPLTTFEFGVRDEGELARLVRDQLVAKARPRRRQFAHGLTG